MYYHHEPRYDHDLGPKELGNKSADQEPPIVAGDAMQQEYNIITAVRASQSPINPL